ncbi:MAG: hypothetical protein CMD13_00840 [Flavobacteriales bacterium]|nr:hypothetical protein [Flavobacteriales bacterium]
MKSDNNINIILTNENFEKGFSKLNKRGIKVFHFPMIKTSSINLEINLNNVDSIIFTSKNGIKYFFKNKLIMNNNLDDKFFICIGKKTAQKLKESGFEAGFVCKRNYSKFMAEEIRENKILKDKKCLLVQGSLSDNSLFDSLSTFSNTQKKVFYKTELIKNKYTELEKIIQNNEPYVIFTSPSSFDSFINVYNPKKVKIVSIGNTTSSHINQKGFNTALTSAMQSFEGISESLITFLKENKEYELSKN